MGSKAADTEGWKKWRSLWGNRQSVNMLFVVPWEENPVSIKPVGLGGKVGKLNAGNELLAVNWELAVLQVEMTVTPGYQPTCLDFELNTVTGRKIPEVVSLRQRLSVFCTQKGPWNSSVLHKHPVWLCRHMEGWHFPAHPILGIMLLFVVLLSHSVVSGSLRPCGL